MNNFDTLLKMLRDLIKKETRYSIPRIGRVLDNKDPLTKGRILVSIPIFGWITRDQGAWCYPKDIKSIITPSIDSYVLVEWIDGDINKPIFTGYANELKDMLPTAYDGVQDTQVLFEGNDRDTSIVFDEKTKIMALEGFAQLNLLSATESFVKGDTHRTALDNLCTTLAAIVPAGSSAANIAAIQAAFATFSATLSSMLSTTIKGE